MVKKIILHRSGGIMINTLIIAFFLVATGTAFIMWAVNENHQANFDLARTQAYYVAQQGIMERALTSMRNRPVETLPAGREFFDPGDYYDIDDNYIGRYHDITLERVSVNAEFGIFDIQYTYDLKGSGTVPLRRSNGMKEDITRSITMRAMLRTYASYMYLTKHEVTRFNEIIWFWGPDDLDGPVHSNDYIGIHDVPHFFDRFTSSAPELAEGSDQTGWFAYDPVFNSPKVFFPETANSIRSCASNGGMFLENDYGLLQTRLQAAPGGWLAYQWLMGTPFDSSHADMVGTIPYNGAIFVEGDLEIFGEYVAGNNNVGCSGNMWLMDNICYTGIDPDNPVIPEDFPHMLGLISEQKIVIKDTYANGRANSSIGSDITITAALVALGESFTFEHQNDEWDTYIYCTGANAGSDDERGEIRLRGSVTQKRRGYVHRSNCGGTGYAKDYVYDQRLRDSAPPCFIEAVDENGSGLFDIVEWKEEMPE